MSSSGKIIFGIFAAVNDLVIQVTREFLRESRIARLVRLGYRGKLIEYQTRTIYHDDRKENGRSAVQVERLEIYRVEKRAGDENKDADYYVFHLAYGT